MKKYVPAAIFIALALAAVLAWRNLIIQRDRGAVLVENGAARRLGDEELRKLQGGYALPGDNGRPAATPSVNPDVRRNLDTIEQVNRINRINKRQKGS
jgi:hypothetical protein